MAERSSAAVSERLRALGRQLATGGDYRIDAAAALIDDMVAVLEADAEACAACDGTGRLSRHIEGQDTQAAQDADEQPCEDCADIRAVIARAEGRSAACPDCGGKGARAPNGVEYCNCDC